MIDLKNIDEMVRKIFENSFEISLLQDELESMLNAIYRNSAEFERGKLSRNAFKTNETKMKRRSVGIIKSVKGLIKTNIDLLVNMKSDIEKQDCKTNIITKTKKSKRGK
ncbi:MAG: hypothetical protein V1818_01450 [Candidatus Aenigmatarchaeota archaeon]